MRTEQTEIFEGKSLSGLLEDIYNISGEKRAEIKNLIIDLTKMMKTPNDAMMLAPIIHQFMEVAVKNDDQLTKIATIIQRLISSEYKTGSGDPSEILSDKEKEQLLSLATKELISEVTKIEADIDSINKKK